MVDRNNYRFVYSQCASLEVFQLIQYITAAQYAAEFHLDSKYLPSRRICYLYTLMCKCKWKWTLREQIWRVIKYTANVILPRAIYLNNTFAFLTRSVYSDEMQ